MLELVSQNSGINSSVNLYYDLKIAICTPLGFNQTKLDVFCKKEWIKRSGPNCAKLMETSKRIAVGIIDKGGYTKAWSLNFYFRKNVYEFSTTCR